MRTNPLILANNKPPTGIAPAVVIIAPAVVATGTAPAATVIIPATVDTALAVVARNPKTTNAALAAAESTPKTKRTAPAVAAARTPRTKGVVPNQRRGGRRKKRMTEQQRARMYPVRNRKKGGWVESVRETVVIPNHRGGIESGNVDWTPEAYPEHVIPTSATDQGGKHAGEATEIQNQAASQGAIDHKKSRGEARE